MPQVSSHLGTALAVAVLLAAPVAVWANPDTGSVNLIGRAVPDIDQLPASHYKTLVTYGKELTERTFAHIGPEVQNPKMRLAGNNLSCTSCHQASATKPFAMPWMGVSSSFPQYRAREDAVSTVEERVNGCMQRSMNGQPLAFDSQEMKAYVAYIAFLSQGIPMGAKLEGAATVQSRMPNRRADVQAGAHVYVAKCAVCHGDNGQGQRVGQVGDAQGYTFPPLWGPDSFNDGAGMNRVVMATRFIKHNMPSGASHNATLLTDDEAYDVAAFMVSQPRPKKAHLEADFPARWNKPVDAAFPPYMLGTPDQHKYGPFPPLADKQRQMAEQIKADVARENAARAAAQPR
jgi:thiosulfate dehydrogenase